MSTNIHWNWRIFRFFKESFQKNGRKIVTKNSATTKIGSALACIATAVLIIPSATVDLATQTILSIVSFTGVIHTSVNDPDDIALLGDNQAGQGQRIGVLERRANQHEMRADQWDAAQEEIDMNDAAQLNGALEFVDAPGNLDNLRAVREGMVAAIDEYQEPNEPEAVAQLANN